MSEQCYKLGDRGVTRDGRTVTCRDDRGDGFMFPLGWWTDSGIRWWTTRNGDCASNGIEGCRIIRRRDDAKVEPEPAVAEVTKDEPAGDLKPKHQMSFDSPKYDFDGMLVNSSVVNGDVFLNFSSDAAQLPESDVPILLRTIETVMEQARRAKEALRTIG